MMAYIKSHRSSTAPPPARARVFPIIRVELFYVKRRCMSSGTYVYTRVHGSRGYNTRRERRRRRRRRVDGLYLFNFFFRAVAPRVRRKASPPVRGTDPTSSSLYRLWGFLNFRYDFGFACTVVYTSFVRCTHGQSIRTKSVQPQRPRRSAVGDCTEHVIGFQLKPVGFFSLAFNCVRGPFFFPISETNGRTPDGRRITLVEFVTARILKNKHEVDRVDDFHPGPRHESRGLATMRASGKQCKSVNVSTDLQRDDDVFWTRAKIGKSIRKLYVYIHNMNCYDVKVQTCNPRQTQSIDVNIVIQ